MTTQPELVVCAEANNLPFSNEREEGFENRLASLLSDELGVRLVYKWMDLTASLRRHALLERGDCDLVMAVAEGQQGYLTTISYYLSSHVFVYREASPFEVTSLDDAMLRDLRIGVQVPAGGGAGPPLEALARRSLIPNAVRFAPEAESEQPLGGIVDAVASGEVDVAIVWGPVAGYFAAQQSVELAVVPVEPAIDPPFQPMMFAIAIGARPGDEALIERLNLALASRWDEVLEILDEANVPQSPLPPPAPSILDNQDDLLRLGLVVPNLTENSTILGTYYTDLLGEAARLGGLLAEAELPGMAEGPLPKLLLASSPTAETAARAARRLVAVEGVDVLIGGVGAGQAEALSRVAEAADALFFNIAAPQAALREECAGNTFHVEASAQMYLTALFDWFSRGGNDRWFVVYERTEEGVALAELATSVVESGAAGRAAAGTEILGSVGVEPRSLSYLEELRTIAEADPDVVLLLLRAEDQTDFLAQQQVSGQAVAIASFPHPETQTRERLANTMSRSLNESLRYRVQSWEPTLGMEEGAGEGDASLNARFVGRWGRPMDPTAWAAYQAVAAAWAVAAELEDFSVEAAVELLEGSSDELGLVKPTLGSGPRALQFRKADHQLLQPLYVVEIEPEAGWSNRVSDQLAIASAVAVIEAPWEREGAGALDQNGERVPGEEGVCR